jgi:MFS superfamily sulfate permease-like transporter
MKPLMQMALTLTLILTGFACAYVAMAIPKKNSEMASALLIAVFITFFSAWIGLLVGIILSILVIGIDKTKN